MKLIGLNTIAELKITDFGVSKAFNKYDTHNAHTVAGTSLYMSPEVANASECSPYDAFKADSMFTCCFSHDAVFSLGVIMLEMMSEQFVIVRNQEVGSGILPPIQTKEFQKYSKLLPIALDCCHVEPSQRLDISSVRKSLEQLQS